MPVVKWLRYTFQLKASNEISFDSDETSSTMIIKKTCADDAGIFTCLLENPAGATKSSTNLTVMELKVMESNQQHQSSSMSTQQQQEQSSAYTASVSSSTVKKQSVSSSSMIQQSSSSIVNTSGSQEIATSKTMHVKKNDKIRIDIQFKDGSKSDLTFTHNGTALTDSNRDGVAIAFKNDIASLTINNAESKHSGIYECIMKTEGGEARCSVHCQVVED